MVVVHLRKFFSIFDFRLPFRLYQRCVVPPEAHLSQALGGKSTMLSPKHWKLSGISLVLISTLWALWTFFALLLVGTSAGWSSGRKMLSIALMSAWNVTACMLLPPWYHIFAPFLSQCWPAWQQAHHQHSSFSKMALPVFSYFKILSHTLLHSSCNTAKRWWNIFNLRSSYFSIKIITWHHNIGQHGCGLSKKGGGADNETYSKQTNLRKLGVENTCRNMLNLPRDGYHRTQSIQLLPFEMEQPSSQIQVHMGYLLWWGI